MNDLDITALIAASRRGDEEAKAVLLGCFRPYLRLLSDLHVRPLLQAKFDASDIVQETCLQAAVSLDEFQGDNEQQFAAWLRQIMANRGAWMARKYLGTEKRDVRLEQRLQNQLEQSSIDIAKFIPDRNSTPSEQVMRRERSVLLADAMDQVQGEQREVLIMHGLQGKSIAEVAKSMRRSEASVWKLWARGLQALRKTTGDES
jgi:RNA polymerase sigma-70 factor (ECF subfamily)